MLGGSGPSNLTAFFVDIKKPMEGSGFPGRQGMVGFLTQVIPFSSDIKGDLRKGGISGEEVGMVKS